MKETIRLISVLNECGVKSASQQIVIINLYHYGKLSFKEIKSLSDSVDLHRKTIEYLMEKGLVESKKTYLNHTFYCEYKLIDEVVEFIKNKI
jgi:hypothetical protein